MQLSKEEQNHNLKSALRFLRNSFVNNLNGEELIRQLNNEACLLTKSRIAALFILDNISYEFKLAGKYSSVKTIEVNRAFDFLIEEGVLSNVLKSGEITVRLINNYDFVWLVPIKNKNTIIAFQLLITDKRHDVSEEQVATLSIINSILADRIIENKYLLDSQHNKTRDNSELFIQIENLKRGAEDLHKIIDSIQEGILLINKDTKQIYDANETALKLISTSKDNLIGKNKDDFFLFFDNMIFKDEIITKEEALLVDIEGNTIPIINATTDITLGEYEYQIISFLDISERKTMEDKIQQSRFELEIKVEDRTRELLTANKELENEIVAKEKAQQENLILVSAIKQTTSLIMITDLEGKIKFANPAVCNKTGYELSELIGKNPKIFKSGNMAEAGYHQLWNNLEAGKSFQCEFKNRKKNGEYFWVSSNISSIIDENGTILSYISVQDDITERKKAEEENLKLLQAIEQTESFVTITDLEYRIEYVNPALTNKTGYSLEELIGKTPVIFKQKGEDSVAYKNSYYAVKNGTQWNGEHHMRSKNGEVFWVSTHISPIRNRSDEIIKYMAVQEDITERKKAELELKSAKEKVEKAERAKSSLLANMSHEFRTPLISILGFSELLEYDLTDNEQKEMIYSIQAGGKRLLNSLESILTLSHLESSNLVFTMKEVNLIPLLHNTVKLFTPGANKKFLELKFETSLEEINVTTEENLLIQTLNHLLDNAIKYTSKGEVKITLDYTIDNENDFILISIHDTGIGITEEDQLIIFDAFRQASEGYSRNYEGFGLGLTIAQKTIHLMKGKITVRSTPKVGSIFTIWLPFSSIK